MAGNKTCILTKEEFNFLESEYDFRLSECKRENWGFSLIYLNDTTGVEILYEYREVYVFIMLYKLIDGILIKNPIIIRKNSVLFGHSLDDIILIRNPDSLIRPAYEYGEDSVYYNEDNGTSLYLKCFSDNLKTYAKDVLRGDFSIFLGLDEVVKNRKKY